MKTNHFTTPIILILISSGLFFGFIKKEYAKIGDSKKVIAVYDDAQVKADELKARRENLQKKLLGIGNQNIKDLETILPDSVDTVRLILDLNGIASHRGITINSVKLTDDSKASSDAPASNPAPSNGGNANTVSTTAYSFIGINFSVTTTYDQFIAFISDVEQSLRIIDITSIALKPEKDPMYEFSVSARTYWMK